MYAKWITVYRDLPLLINQWANVVRWEMRTRLFLRTTEFLWQEGHTAHATEEEAEEETLRMLDVYRDVRRETSWRCPVIHGVKTETEKFAGALRTYCIEAMMQDGKALQAGTSHDLGQNFAKAFDVKFQDRDGQAAVRLADIVGRLARGSSAPSSWRTRRQGPRAPAARSRPSQVVIVPIYSSEDGGGARDGVRRRRRRRRFAGRVTYEIDDRDQYKPGWKYTEWELKGVPLRIEIGPRDVEKGHVMLVRRDGGPKQAVPASAVAEAVPALLEEIQASLFKRALDFREANTFDADDHGRFEEIFQGEGGFVRARWCGGAECEASVKERLKATIRVIPFGAPDDPGPCAACGTQGTGPRVIWAKSY